uniref:Major facilitator superfamily (MFS) profile domain-containing protein n=1 Tax=Parascaris univalens TaxID=6257 RepID=A0A915APU7_PARUN
MSRRLGLVTLTHAILGSFGDIEAGIFNLMTVPLKVFFNESLTAHYGDVSAESFSLYFSTVASLLFVGIIIGAFTMGYLMDYIGRKPTAVILRSSLGVVSGLCMFIAKPLMCFELFSLGHFLAGIVCAFRIVLVIYMAECSPDNLRGLTSVAMSSGSVLAMVIVTPLCLPSVLGNAELWICLPAICSVMALLHLSIAVFFPQSPKHLYIYNHDTPRSKESVLFYHGSVANFDAIEEEYDRERLLLTHGHTSLLEVISNRTLRWSLAIVMICAFVPTTSAINVKSVYHATMLMGFGFDETQVW